MDMVSILIFMEHLLQHKKGALLMGTKNLFQSLFLWNIYFNLKEMLEGVDLQERFNPYFYGTSTSTK